jgi:8-oxo-dGTP diphosphatase
VDRPYFIVNVEVAIRRDGKFLLIRRSSLEEHSAGTLSLPGGKIDHRAVSPEALEQALRREIEEEVGVTLGKLTYIESKSFIMDTKEWCVSVCFFCEDFTGTAFAKSEDEVDEVIWLAPQELYQQTACPPWTKQSIESANSGASLRLLL